MVRRIKLAKKRAPVKGYTRALQTGSKLKVVDNTGAKIIEIVTVPSYHSVRRRHPSATIGDMVVATVKKGSPNMRNELVRAVIVRMKKEYMRPNGVRIKFEDNAAVIVNEGGDPRGSDVKGVVAREAVERWPGIGKICSMVV